MSQLVVDTNVLIDVLRRVPPARDLLRQTRADGDTLWAPVTGRVELLGGMLEGEAEETSNVLEIVSWIPVTAAIADAAAAYSRRYRRAFSGIDLADYILAATADHMNARLLTRNVKHFPMFEGLAAPY